MQENLYNLAFERSILSSLLFEPSSFEDIGSSLKPRDFYLPAHAAIFEAMGILTQKEKPIDEEFLKKELSKMKKFDEQAMLEIMSANPISNTKAYMEEVVDRSRVRQLLSITTTIKTHAIEENSPSDLIISHVESELDAIIEANLDDFGIIPIEDVEEKETEFILKEWLPIPRGTVTIISAPGGTGKSWTALQMGIRHNTETGKQSALWLSEDPLAESKSRAKAICEKMLGGAKSLKNIRLVDKAPLHLMSQKKFSYADFYKIKKAFKEYDLVVLDPLLAMYGSDENDNSQARQFMQPFMNWAREENKCIVFLHHSKKGGEESRVRGAGAFVDACRTVYEIEQPNKDDHSGKRKFLLSKDNLGAIKHLNSFKVDRQITPYRNTAPISEETIYDSDQPVPFGGTRVNTKPKETPASESGNISIEGAEFL